MNTVSGTTNTLSQQGQDALDKGASTAQSAVRSTQRAADSASDVVLLDLAMPVMDGLEALPTMSRLLPSAKIIVLSGFGATQMSARAVAAVLEQAAA